MKPRARDLGLPFPGTPGRFNAITDVAGIGVGVTTLIASHDEALMAEHASRTFRIEPGHFFDQHAKRGVH